MKMEDSVIKNIDHCALEDEQHAEGSKSLCMQSRFLHPVLVIQPNHTLCSYKNKATN